MVAPAIIGAVGGLLGGLLGNRNEKKAIAAQNAYNHPVQVRARAEEAGFNPLLFVGPGVGQQTAYARDMMGSAIADASMLVADDLARRQEQKGLVAQLEQQNAELRKAFNNATLRPEVAGVYGMVQPVVIQSVVREEVNPTSALTVDDGRRLRYPATFDEATAEPSITPVHKGLESHGQVTHIPSGFDVQEAATGYLVDWYNEYKAFRDSSVKPPVPTQFHPRQVPYDLVFRKNARGATGKWVKVPKPRPTVGRGSQALRTRNE